MRCGEGEFESRERERERGEKGKPVHTSSSSSSSSSSSGLGLTWPRAILRSTAEQQQQQQQRNATPLPAPSNHPAAAAAAAPVSTTSSTRFHNCLMAYQLSDIAPNILPPAATLALLIHTDTHTHCYTRLGTHSNTMRTCRRGIVVHEIHVGERPPQLDCIGRHNLLECCETTLKPPGVARASLRYIPVSQLHWLYIYPISASSKPI
ncbi:unnamed protein product [Trichogramma brassicae]|uniref:Uncharacterized protein n=1 Tax=Trichogramma brassicae TaxID=86971 RepID=A0A6H5IWT4_9HYME|nr:unnamed protein product [Trichogramma brassicae]